MSGKVNKKPQQVIVTPEQHCKTAKLNKPTFKASARSTPNARETFSRTTGYPINRFQRKNQTP